MKNICKHIAIVAALFAGVAAASSAVIRNRTEWTGIGDTCSVTVIEVENHRYVVTRYYNYHGGGVSMVHANSCPCIDVLNQKH